MYSICVFATPKFDWDYKQGWGKADQSFYTVIYWEDNNLYFSYKYALCGGLDNIKVDVYKYTQKKLDL